MKTQKKQRIRNKYYHFFISLIITGCITGLFLSMYVSYFNTQKLGFGESIPPINIYRQVDGDLVFVFGNNQYKLRSPIEKL